ncbi:MAG TPA: hypothetical protein VFZ23_02235 [Pyrinomonadaceae bacterium]
MSSIAETSKIVDDPDRSKFRRGLRLVACLTEKKADPRFNIAVSEDMFSDPSRKGVLREVRPSLPDHRHTGAATDEIADELTQTRSINVPALTAGMFVVGGLIGYLIGCRRN